MKLMKWLDICLLRHDNNKAPLIPHIKIVDLLERAGMKYIINFSNLVFFICYMYEWLINNFRAIKNFY